MAGGENRSEIFQKQNEKQNENEYLKTYHFIPSSPHLPFMRIIYRLTFQTTQRKFANKKMKKIQVEKQDIRVAFFHDQEYICLTDMMPSKDGEFFVSDWLRNRNTLEFLGIWESIHNPSFNYGEFAAIKSQSGLNHLKLSVKHYISLTNGKGIIAKAGRYGGTFTHQEER